MTKKKFGYSLNWLDLLIWNRTRQAACYFSQQENEHHFAVRKMVIGAIRYEDARKDRTCDVCALRDELSRML